MALGYSEFNYLEVLMSELIATALSSKNEMKEIKYRGGVVRFFVPKNWIENYETDGGGMFYEDAPDTGTFRLNLITVMPPTPLKSDAAFDTLSLMNSVKPDSIERLQNGNAITSWVEHSSEQEQAITVYWWHVANPVPPNHIRIANFSYAVLASQESSPTTKTEVQMLANSISNAAFHSTLGE
jgi:hypothetical protein